MNRQPVSNASLIARTTFTLAIWLLAFFVLSACSTNIWYSTQAESMQPVAVEKVQSHNVSEKKQRFFALMKPLVVAENKRVLQQRQHIKRLKSAGTLGKQELESLQQLAATYKLHITGQPSNEQWQTLLDRVDVIPVEMALVQAANESAWGQSRFAVQANNYFGQWCYQQGCGLVPKRRAVGATHEVKRFATVDQSVAAYMRNINTSRAYAEFRDIRHSLRIQSKPLDAERLAYGLKSYSERGMDYVKIIQSMIRSNRKLIRQT